VDLRSDRRGSVIHAWRDAYHPERLAVEVLFKYVRLMMSPG